MNEKNAKGYIYVLSNPSFNKVKIGYSERDPIVRVSELDTTGVPTPFILEYSVLIHNARGVEQRIHELLDNYRVNQNREFFDLSVSDAIIKIRAFFSSNNITILLEELKDEVILDKPTDGERWPFPTTVIDNGMTKERVTTSTGSKSSDKINDALKGKESEDNRAFMRPQIPSDALAAIVGHEPQPRTEVVSKVWAYIKKNGLQDRVNNRNINADDHLRAVFGKAQVTMFELASLIGKHLK